MSVLGSYDESFAECWATAAVEGCRLSSADWVGLLGPRELLLAQADGCRCTDSNQRPPQLVLSRQSEDSSEQRESSAAAAAVQRAVGAPDCWRPVVGQRGI